MVHTHTQHLFMPPEITVCTQCHTPFEYGPTVSEIDFPEDYAAIFDMVEHRLNVFKCPECGHDFFKTDWLVITNPQAEVLLYTTDPEIADAYTRETQAIGTTLFHTTSYSELYDALLQWLLPYVNQFPDKLKTLLQGDPGAAACPVDPITLRILLSAKYGFLVLTVQEEQPMDAATLFPIVARNCVLWIFNHCSINNRVLDFPKETEAAIPPDCLTSEVLDWFVSSAHYPPADNIKAFHTEWGVAFMCAVLHDIAGLDNPLQSNFCSLIDMAWERFPPSTGTVSPFVFLDKALGQRFLSFNILYNILLEKIGRLDIKDRMAQLVSAQAMMSFYGWQHEYDEVASSRIAVQFGANAPIEQIAENIIDLAVKPLPFSAGGQSAARIAATVAGFIKVFLNTRRTDLCKLVISRSVSIAESMNDHISSILICLQCAKELNRVQELGLAADCIETVNTSFAMHHHLLSPVQQIDRLFETANSKRYFAHYQASLQALDDAAAILPELEEADRQQARSIIRRNRALCYRDMGEFAKALPMMQEGVAEHPGDFGVAQNLVMLYIKLNIYDKALDCLEPFRQHQALSVSDELSYHLVSAWLHQATGDTGAAQHSAALALKQYNRYNLLEQCQLLNVLLMAGIPIPGADNPGINDMALALIGAGNHANEHHNLFLTTCYLFLGKLLKDKDLPSAQSLISSMPSLLTLQGSWEFMHIIAWYYLETGDHPHAADAIGRLMKKFNEVVPSSDNIAFTIDWFSDKDYIQRHVITMAKRLFDAGAISIFTFIGIIEISYGREITSRLTPSGAAPSVTEVLQAIATNLPHTELFVLFEIDDGVYFINISTTQTRIIVARDQLCTIEEASAISRQAFNAYKHAVPSAKLLKYTNNQLAGMYALFNKMGKIFSQWIGEDTQKIYFIPGRSLANLPLHLMPYGKEQTLIEKFPVGYMNNLSALSLLTRPPARAAAATIVTVTKEQESEDYIQQAFTAADRIGEQLNEGAYTVCSLRQEEGTIDNVLSALNRSGEAVFICHGSAGTATQGAGICLAFRNQLPTEFLSLRSALLDNFLLTWKHLSGIHLPALIVSTACSSGTTRVGQGGVQLGFEQTAFAQGCTTIISPLWDVYQPSSLFWLERFFENRAQNPTLDWIASYRAACLDTKIKYPHHFFWAPFIFKGI